MEERVDKYLFAMRIYKTRSIATEACKKGRVTMNGMETHRSINEIIFDLKSLDCNAFRNDLESNHYDKYLITDSLFYLEKYKRILDEREWELARAYGLH